MGEQKSWLTEQLAEHQRAEEARESRSSPPVEQPINDIGMGVRIRTYGAGSQASNKHGGYQTGEMEMTEVQLHPRSKGDMAKRIADRLNPSNEMTTADVHTQHGTSPLRTHSTVHHSGSNKSHGPSKGKEKPHHGGQL
jgi:hypothetical protein